MLYQNEKALYELDFERDGFEWIDFQDWESSVITFIRKGKSTSDIILVVCNFTPVLRHDYIVGVPRGGFWKEILNSDSELYGGTGMGNLGGHEAGPDTVQGRHFSISLTLPPLTVTFFKNEAAF